MDRSEERGTERLMDEYLKSKGFHRKKIAKDGSCLFRAVAEQVLHSQSLHTEVRAKCVDFLKQNRESYEAFGLICFFVLQFIEGEFEDYLFKLQDPQQWVGEVEINALAVMYKRDFEIFQVPGQPAVNITDNNFKDKVRLCFLNGNHYDSVYPISSVKSAALCQSVLYELLYEGVFKVDRSFLGMCQRNSRASDLLSDDNMAACASSDESDLDASEALWVENGTNASAPRHNQSYRGRGRGRQLPERVRRSLNPTLLRNVEYDVWHKTKRAQQKLDYCIAAGMQYTAGDRCQVPLWSLRAPSDESSWSTVGNRDKRLSNGHGDWEEKGRGRGRGKPAPASSSVAPATSPGSSGRVLRQHTWPPQATVEEQGGARANKKCVSSTESSLFGLTEKQRLAREEEERNVALVEIQLRDEQSFPALGAQLGIQGEAGRKKGAEKKRSQRYKMKSPIEDVRAPSPSAAERPQSSTPPLATTAATTALTTNTTTPTSPLPAASAPAVDSSPDWLSSHKAPTPNINSAVSGSAPSLPLTCVCDKTTASAAAPLSSPPSSAAAAAPSTKPPSIPSSATHFSFLPPVLPAASSPPSLTPQSSTSPPPSSTLPPPTFIAPIAPVAAQGFLPRSSPPVSSLPHSPSPPSFPSSAQSSSSSSLIHHAPQVHGAPPAPAQTPNSLPNIGGTLTATQTFSQPSLAQIQTQSQASHPQNHMLKPSMQTEAQSSLPHLQPQSHTEVASVPQNQPQSHPATTASYPHTSQPSVPVSASMPQPPITQPHLHSQPAQPPHPSQVPHPSLSLAASPSHPSLQTQTSNIQNQTEVPPPPAQPESQPHPPSLHPSLQSAHPVPLHHHHQSITGAFPLHQMSQLYQDPLYPGFPQGEKGDVVGLPPFSTSKSGDDLPQDINVLRFFFNLGVKAYSMPMYHPYIYLFPLQHAHALRLKIPSRSPSPTPAYPPPNPPTRHKEVYQHLQYPSTSATVAPQYDQHVAPHVAPQAPPTELPYPSEPAPSAAGYPVTQPVPNRMPWQHQLPPPRNSSYPVRYHAPSPPYPAPPPSAQGYHTGQSSGHPPYPPGMPQYPSPSLGYPSSATTEELQVSHGLMEQLHPSKGGPASGHGAGRVPSPLEGSAAANVANANNNRTMVVSGVSGFGLKKEQGESLTPVLLVDPPLNNTPIVAWVSEPEVKDVPVSMTTMKTPSSTHGSPGHYDLMPKRSVIHSDNNPPHMYRSHHKSTNHSKPYTPPEAGFLTTVAMAEPLSVGCNTEDVWEESEGFKPPTSHHRGSRRSYRGGGGGRGRGYRRRQVGEAGEGLQFSSSHRGRGRERGY
ncbi:hypothetical protein PAMP_016010 [Pampus punctatissimus]